MLNDRQTIDQIIVRREALASLEAAEATDLLGYVDSARVAGERVGGEARGRRRIDAAVHELSLAMKLPVSTVERRIARARRLRSSLPTVWQAWHDGRVSTLSVDAIDRAARRLVRAESVNALDESVVNSTAGFTPSQVAGWLDRWVERVECDASDARRKIAQRDRSVRLRALGDGMTPPDR